MREQRGKTDNWAFYHFVKFTHYVSVHARYTKSNLQITDGLEVDDR